VGIKPTSEGGGLKKKKRTGIVKKVPTPRGVEKISKGEKDGVWLPAMTEWESGGCTFFVPAKGNVHCGKRLPKTPKKKLFSSGAKEGQGGAEEGGGPGTVKSGKKKRDNPLL